MGKDLDEFRPGWYAVVFFDEPLEEGETDILYPKEVFFSMPPAAENPQTIEDAIILTQYLSQALIKNFTHLPDKSIFTPDEALLRVADHLNLADVEMVEQPGGTPAYAAGDIGLYFTDIKYNRYFGMDRAEGAEIYQNQSFLDEAEFPDRIMDKPFIQYAVVVASGGHNDVYYVDINGTVTTTSYSFDPVSYTHLDVYKRQGQGKGAGDDHRRAGSVRALLQLPETCRHQHGGGSDQQI